MIDYIIRDYVKPWKIVARIQVICEDAKAILLMDQIKAVSVHCNPLVQVLLLLAKPFSRNAPSDFYYPMITQNRDKLYILIVDQGQSM